MFKLRITFPFIISGLLVACVHMPTGPSVMTLPGAGKSFEQFRADDYIVYYCGIECYDQWKRQEETPKGRETE